MSEGGVSVHVREAAALCKCHKGSWTLEQKNATGAPSLTFLYHCLANIPNQDNMACMDPNGCTQLAKTDANKCTQVLNQRVPAKRTC